MDHLDSMLLNNFLQVKLSYQIAAQCTIYRPCFQFYSPVPNIVSNTVTMYHLPYLFPFIFCISKLFEILSQSTLYQPCFHLKNVLLQFKIFLNTTRVHALKTFFSAVPNNVQYRQNACLRDNVFNFLLCSIKSFQIPW